MRREEGYLSLFGWLVGLFLWCPALALPVGFIFLQPLDVLVLLSPPLLWRLRAVIPPRAIVLLVLFWVSIGLSYLQGGSLVILIYYIVFISLFLLLIGAIMTSRRAKNHLIAGFLIGGWLSFVLFAAQLWLGAEALDFRNNLNFRLPAHFGRGFALFPEVSTFAAHAITWLAILFLLLLRNPSRQGLWLVFMAAIFLLMFTRSTSVIALLPLFIGGGLVVALRPSLNNALLMGVVLGVVTLVLLAFVGVFFVERLETNAAGRSFAMRLASILAGFSTLSSGEVFGVGLGQNDEIRLRAFEIARQTGLVFGRLPEGVNSLVVTRIFEEGWPAVLHLGLPMYWLAQCWRQRPDLPAQQTLLILASSALVISLAIIGYRGIYTSWLWLGIAPALVSPRPTGRVLR